MQKSKKVLSIALAVIMILSSLVYAAPLNAADSVAVTAVGGWNETLYIQLSGVTDSDVTAVSYSGPVSGSLIGEDFNYLVRDYDGGVRVDVLGLKPGTYSITVSTSKGDVTESNIVVEEQDRSGYAHYNYTAGVGAYNDDGTLKDDAIVLYVTNENKDTVSVTSKDGTTVTGIGHILNSAGRDMGNGTTSKGGIANNNNDIIRRLAEDGKPLVVRIVGDVKAPAGLTEYNSLNYGGSVGDNGYMARIHSGKDITIEGVGAGAKINGWGIHFMCISSYPNYGKSFEVRNINFHNVPEDCVGMEGVQTDSVITAGVERCWIHNCSFYEPKISNPAEEDKDGGDGACDFKRGQYFTNSYCYYAGYHKTNLVGGGDSNLQYNMTYHHNYWYDCDSRVPLARQANIHMYNNLVESQNSYIMSLRANCFIFSEYNYFLDSKNVTDDKTGGVCKSYNDTIVNCTGSNRLVVVADRGTTVSSNNKYANFDTNSSLSYIPSGDYKLHTDKSTLVETIKSTVGALKETSASSGDSSDENETGGGSGGEVIVPSPDSYVHIIEKDNVTSDFYSFSTNAYSTSKGSVVLNGTTYTKCLKIQSATTITFNAPSDGKLILGFCSTCAANSVYVDSTIHSLASSQVLTVDITAGSHTIKKKSGESYLYYIIYEPAKTEPEPHEHSYTKEVTTAPTCTEAGEATYTCECGDSYTEDLDALGHSYGSFVIDRHATYTETGEKSRYCSNCNNRIEITEIPMMEALESGLYGDYNSDGVVDIKDAVVIKKHLASIAVDIDLSVGDVNADDIVDIKDAVKLMKAIAGMDVVLGEGA